MLVITIGNGKRESQFTHCQSVSGSSHNDASLARLHTVAAAGHLPTATTGSFSSYTTRGNTTPVAGNKYPVLAGVDRGTVGNRRR